MKILVEIDQRVGGGQCAMSAPDVFEQDDDGLVVVLDDDPAPRWTDDVRLAARLYPARAILVADA